MKVGFLLFLSFISASFIWIMFSQLHNNLESNGSWTASKLTLAKYVYGSEEFFHGRPTLAYNHLNLSAWHGYQEVITKSEYPARIVDFDFKLDKDAYLYFVFNKTPEKFSAVRFSLDQNLPSSYVQASSSGQFTSIASLNFTGLETAHWHHAHISSEEGKNKVTVELDHQPAIELSAEFFSRQKFGFKGSLNQVFVDNVMAKGDKKEVLFFDDFSYHDKLTLPKYLGILIGIFICNGVLYLLIRLGKKREKIAFLTVAMIHISFILVLALSEAYLYFYFINSYPNPDSFFSKLKKQEQTAQVSWADQSNEEIMNKFKQNDSSGSAKVIFIGSSQTWGAGAQNLGDEYVKVAEREANAGTSLAEAAVATPSSLIAQSTTPMTTGAVLGTSTEEKKFEFINAAISGSDSDQELTYYQKYWVNFAPKLMVIDLSYNDHIYGTDFKENLNKFIDINNAHGIKTVFILEACSPQKYANGVVTHEVMKQIAQERGVRTINLHQYLKEKEPTGILWWDDIHPTSYGHQLAGDYVYKNIQDILNTL
jgi:hypothetical protein